MSLDLHLRYCFKVTSFGSRCTLHVLHAPTKGIIMREGDEGCYSFPINDVRQRLGDATYAEYIECRNATMLEF
jgi:hypothetical protein